MLDIDNFMFRGFKGETFPPYNIVKVSDTNYVIELAAAGFNRENIKAYMENGLLVIEGSKQSSDSNYVYKGISTKSFRKTFSILHQWEVESINMIDGILKVNLIYNTVDKNIKLIPIL